MNMPDIPDLPDFDDKRTRRAVRRGLFRTVAIVLAVLALLAVAATEGSSLVQTRGDREHRMQAVLGTAVKIYNPAYTVTIDTCCRTTPVSMSFDMAARPIGPVGAWPAGSESYTISQDFFGRVGRLPLGHTANTRLSQSLFDVGTTLAAKDEVRAVLARLPADLSALAVVEFEQPLGEADLKAFVKRYRTCAERVVYERRPGSLPITWGDDYWTDALEPGKGGDATDRVCGGRLPQFREWVGLLRDHDDANLRSFDLSLDRLRKAAAAGLAHGFVDQLNSVGDLRELLKDPRVRTIRLAGVAFDLDRPDD
ncbi:hypothetical protein FAF44_21745 [Nonomuraea sp. MG754425]|uniref:hypothetical protein n=1 Tax=Nonomuraea sp. MG754425 TaxID=2570319 RepID=UPI001F485F23|nr:hypothetical protein [Nonomuraea sp. MG754425]MCF6471000.1 hypothetical protein [Nonomuraea sp. MG754425]